MSFLDKVGKVAMDAIDKATDVAVEVQKRVDPLIEKSALASKVRERIAPKDDVEVAVPEPESNLSPFATAAVEEDAPPLGDVEIPVQVFGPGTDPWTGRSLQLLRDRTIEHTFVDVEGEDGVQIETQLIKETRQNAPPYIYLRGKFIGGYNALNEIERLGQLEEMTKHPDERDQGTARTRIVIAERADGERPPGELGNPDDR